MALFKLVCWAIIFLTKLRFPPGSSIATSKGVYPYDYMDSFDKFNESLPRKEDFYSVFNDEHISEENY